MNEALINKHGVTVFTVQTNAPVEYLYYDYVVQFILCWAVS